MKRQITMGVSLILGLLGSFHLLAAPIELDASWKDGIRLESSDKVIQLQVGGRLQTDFHFYVDSDDSLESAVGQLDDGVEIRRARLYFAGTIYENIEFKSQYDFAGAEVSFKDQYIGLKNIPMIGTFRVGHQYEPFGLEAMTSSKYLTFIERGTLDTFIPYRNMGFRMLNDVLDERGTWSFGVYKDTENGDDLGDEWNLSARVTALPWMKSDAEYLHIGLAYSYRDFDGDRVRYRARPEVHNTERFVDTGELVNDDANIVGLEAALVYGAFSIQGEYVMAMTENEDFSGFYAYLSYFLTGESRPYKKSLGYFSRVKPNENFAWNGGKGAWEVALRYSNLDLNDAAVLGGELNDITAALNWYLNPNTRVMLNYVYADVEKLGSAHIVETRFQVDF